MIITFESRLKNARVDLKNARTFYLANGPDRWTANDSINLDQIEHWQKEVDALELLIAESN